MTRYTVTWWQESRDELARLWLRSENKAAITLAANTIDQTLSADPMHHGEQSHEGLLRLVVEPLHVQFSVNEGDRLVQVWFVRIAGEPT